MNTTEPTRVSVLTGSGRGAVAVIAVSGPEAVATVDRFFQAANGRSLIEQPLQRIVYGQWGGAVGEDLIVCRRAEQLVEVHCHGGTASISQIQSNFLDAGCIEVDWKQWTVDQAKCPFTAEAQIALANASTQRTANILLDQYHGALRRSLEEIVDLLRNGSPKKACEQIQQLLATAEIGLHLTEPWQVVLAGLPNVGKSSLINAMVGYQRAIVFDQPGTTRDVVTATTAADGWPLQLSDTAGLHAATDELETAGIDRAKLQLQEADLVLWVLDASLLGKGDERSLKEIARKQMSQASVDIDWSTVLLVANKIDLLPEEFALDSGAIATCAVSGKGITELLDRISTKIAPCPPSKGEATIFTHRQLSRLQKAIAFCEDGTEDKAAETIEELFSSHD